MNQTFMSEQYIDLTEDGNNDLAGGENNDLAGGEGWIADGGAGADYPIFEAGFPADGGAEPYSPRFEADIKDALMASDMAAHTDYQEKLHLARACAISLKVPEEEQAAMYAAIAASLEVPDEEKAALDAAIAASLEVQDEQTALEEALQASRGPVKLPPAAAVQGLGQAAAGGGLPLDHPEMVGRGADGRLLRQPAARTFPPINWPAAQSRGLPAAVRGLPPTASELRAEAAMRRMMGADGTSLPQKRPRSPEGEPKICLQREEDSKLCVICKDRPSCMVSLPCGHINKCEDCSKQSRLSKPYCMTCNVWGDADPWTCSHMLTSRTKCLTCNKWETSCVRVFMP